jgi:hypothetical protein
VTEETRTALVVLHPGQDPQAAPERAGETPPDPPAVERVVGWFRDQGFETGPFVGISFAVMGNDALFHEVLGDASATEGAGDDQQFPLDGLDDDVAQLVAAVVLPSPPDFGPGNP